MAEASLRHGRGAPMQVQLGPFQHSRNPPERNIASRASRTSRAHYTGLRTGKSVAPFEPSQVAGGNPRAEG
jgi:hypothetical protein